MNKIQVEIKNREITVKEKSGVRSWNLEIEDNWKEELIKFFQGHRKKWKVELYLGEEYFIVKRIYLDFNENIKERIEEELEEEVERKAYRWIPLEKGRENPEYIIIFISERELEKIKEFIRSTGNSLTLLAPAFARDKNINFIIKKKKWIFFAPALFLLEVCSFFIFKELERGIKIQRSQLRGQREETDKALNNLIEENKNNQKQKEEKPVKRDSSKVPLMLEIIKSVPEEIYLESWEVEKNRMKVKGSGKLEQLYKLERMVIGKRGVSWAEIEYIKKQEKGYQFLMEIWL